MYKASLNSTRQTEIKSEEFFLDILYYFLWPVVSLVNQGKTVPFSASPCYGIDLLSGRCGSRNLLCIPEKNPTAGPPPLYTRDHASTASTQTTTSSRLTKLTSNLLVHVRQDRQHQRSKIRQWKAGNRSTIHADRALNQHWKIRVQSRHVQSYLQLFKLWQCSWPGDSMIIPPNQMITLKQCSRNRANQWHAADSGHGT